MNKSRRRLLQQLTVLGLLSGAGIPGLIREALAAGNYPVMQGMRRIKGEVRINGKRASEGQAVLRYFAVQGPKDESYELCYDARGPRWTLQRAWRESA